MYLNTLSRYAKGYIFYELLNWNIQLAELRICWLYSCSGVRLPPEKKGSVLSMTLNCIWWFGSSSGALGSVEYIFISITPRPTLTGVVVLVSVPWMGQIDLFKKICIQWNHVQKTDNFIDTNSFFFFFFLPHFFNLLIVLIMLSWQTHRWIYNIFHII